MKPETRSFYEAAVVRAVERVAGSLDEALELDALAREAALSPFHFHRVFRGLVGETPLELHRRLRLERAAARRRALVSANFVQGAERARPYVRRNLDEREPPCASS